MLRRPSDHDRQPLARTHVQRLLSIASAKEGCKLREAGGSDKVCGWALRLCVRIRTDNRRLAKD